MPHLVSKASGHAVLINKEGRVLILKSSVTSQTPKGSQNLWMLPGGRIDEGETSPTEALQREIKEETGITTAHNIIPIHTSIWNGQYCTTRFSVVYLGLTDGSEEINLQAEEIAHYEWVTFNDAFQKEYLEPNLLIALKKAQKIYPLFKENLTAFSLKD